MLFYEFLFVHMTSPNRTLTALTTAGALLLAPAFLSAAPAKNIILMIADGAGPSTWTAANQWQFGAQAGSAPEFQQAYESADFQKHWLATYPGHSQPLPPGQIEARLSLPPIGLPDLLPQVWNEIPFFDFGSYDPAKANDLTSGPVNLFSNGTLLTERGPAVPLTPRPTNSPAVQQLALFAAGEVPVVQDQGFNAYEYLMWNATDSAAAGTAMASGVKTYSSAINYDLDGNPVPFFTQQVKATGRKAGIVTTKPFTDATPASFGTQNDFRDDEAEISHDMIHNGLLDVIITPGHPEFGGAGVPRAEANYDTISEDNLASLRDGSAGWSLVEDPDALTDIGNGTTPAPGRLFGLLPTTSQLNSRDTSGRTNAYDPRFHDPENPPEGVVPFEMPDLDVLTQAAINALKTDADGFFLMVEGAAVDSGAHGNDLARTIEEMLAFNRAVDQAIQWIETESSWEETLLIVTTDHANGMFLGPESDTIPFQDPEANAAGELPDGIWWSTNHTNELVPLFARGPLAEAFAARQEGVDPRRGPYGHLADVHGVMSQAIIPEPGATPLAFLGLAVIALVIHRRR